MLYSGEPYFLISVAGNTTILSSSVSLIKIAAQAGARAGASMGITRADKSGAEAGALAGAEAGRTAGAEAGAKAAAEAATTVVTKTLNEAMQYLEKIGKPVGILYSAIFFLPLQIQLTEITDLHHKSRNLYKHGIR